MKRRENEALYRQIVETAAEGVWLVDARGVTQFANRQMAAMLGYSAEEMVGKPFVAVLDEEAASVAKGDWDLLKRGERVQREFPLRRKEGATTWALINVSPILDPKGAFTGALAMVTDTGGLKNAEEDLRLKGAALDAAANAVMIADRPGRVVWVNPAFTRVTGYGPEEVLGQTPRLLRSGKHDEGFYRDLWQTILSGRVWNGEIANRRKDGSLYYEDMTIAPVRDRRGEVFHFIAIKQDITGRKIAEEALRRANRAYRTLSECNQALVRATEESPWLSEMCRILVEIGGYRLAWIGLAEQDAKKTIRPAAHAGHAAGYLEALDITWADTERGRGPVGTAIRTGQPCVARDMLSDPRFVPWREEAAKRGYVSVAALPLIFKGQVLGSLNIYAAEPAAFDEQELTLMTELAGDLAFGISSLQAHAHREEATEALRQKEEQLRQSQKMEAVGRLAGGVAHDFNNLLTAILGYGNFLKASFESGDKRLEDVKEILASAERAAGLTRQLLAFSRKQVLAPRVLDLNAVVSNIDKMLRRIIGEDIKFTLRLDPGLKRARVDPGQIEQVAMNLAVNARDAMPEGGDLLIETSNAVFDEQSPGRHDVIPPGSYVMLAVSDTGYGMDEQTKSRLFEPFFTTKEKGKGTGLGLSTVYGIVKQSGGHIWVYSELGKGSVFKIYLPATERSSEPFIEEPAGSPKLKGSETVLLVEDEDLVRNLFRRALKSNGYKVIEAKTGAEGLQAFRRHLDRIQLVVTDMVMPGGGGKILGDQIHALRPDVKIIYMSGYTDEAILRHGQLGSGMVFLQKPLAPNRLLVKVRQVLDYKPKGNDEPKGRP